MFGHYCLTPLHAVGQTTDAIPEGGGGEGRVNTEIRCKLSRRTGWVGFTDVLLHPIMDDGVQELDRKHTDVLLQCKYRIFKEK